MIGLQTGPAKIPNPALKEFSGPRLGFETPEMPETFFEEMGLHNLFGKTQEIIQSTPSLPADMDLPGQEDELLAGQQPSEPALGLSDLSLTDTVQGIQEVPDHMELVVENHRLGTMGSETFDEAFPHVHDRMGDPFGSLFPEPLPEFFQVFFLSALADKKQFWPMGAFQGADHMPIAMAFSHGDFVHSQNPDAFERSGGLGGDHGRFVDSFDCMPMQILKQPHGFIGHGFTEFRHQAGQRNRDTGIFGHPGKGFHLQAATVTFNPVFREPQEGHMFPQRQMLHDPIPVTDPLLFPLTATAALEMAQVRPVQRDQHMTSKSFPFLFYSRDTKSGDSQQFCDTMKVHRHPKGPPSIFQRIQRVNLFGCLFSMS
jgi:hypothetical protein